MSHARYRVGPSRFGLWLLAFFGGVACVGAPSTPEPPAPGPGAGNNTGGSGGMPPSGGVSGSGGPAAGGASRSGIDPGAPADPDGGNGNVDTGSAGPGGGEGRDGATGGSAEAGAMAPSACPELTAGWSRYQPTRNIQFEGGDSFCSYRDEGGVESFKMMKNPAGVIQRCEARVQNNYLSGINQFEGDVKITIGEATCVHQVFKGLMLDAFPDNGGEIRMYSGKPLVAGVFGRWVHVNTIHDVAKGTLETYIDCVRKDTRPHASPPDNPNGWYNKYGLYGVQGVAPRGQVSQVDWKNVHHYRK